MKKELATKILTNVLEGSFSKERFSSFAKDLLKKLDDQSDGAVFSLHGAYIADQYKPYIQRYDRIGKYEDSKGKRVDVLVVYLKKETSLERARTMQRNFVAWYLNGSRGGTLKDAALVAFISPSERDWRFSLVKMEYHLAEKEEGGVKTEKELTPARRFSYLVGEGEKSHTAKSQLLPLLESDQPPTLAELEEAFNVEKVTKEFFTKYRELYHSVAESLTSLLSENSSLKEEFVVKGVEIDDFAKKLLGQIVFLYFLQKKGWFGVERDADWGTGPRDFLRRLFDKKHAGYTNFFNDILEPLFYEALATERTGDFYSRFNCKIPFLNGGLFDPLSGYNWVHQDILLPDGLFSNNRKTKEGDIGDGILDIFDRYNFTVKEDEPLEKEVAVDPEMLGKVFENLLEVKDRKSKGTYYTPREIVHYMCQESLVNYLIAETGVEEERVRGLVNPKVLTQEDYHKYRRDGGSKDEVFEGSVLALWEGEAEKLDEALANIKVCDPACGSGAFLVGMLQEVVHARKRLGFALGRATSTYELKQHAIQDGLYGVDIDPGAVEIAKLRLWLSLVVEEESIKNIRPLPNLDYKIMQGNSLLGEYEGVELIDRSFFEKEEPREKELAALKERQNELQQEYIKLHSERNLTKIKKAELAARLKTLEKQIKSVNRRNETNAEEPDLFAGQSKAQQKAEKLQELQKKFFEAARKSEKDKLKRGIEELTWDLIETTLREQGKEDRLEEIAQFKRSNTKPFFLWHLNFSEVFQEKGGFDVIIANPPYVSFYSRESIKPSEEIEIALRNKFSKTVEGRLNTFLMFLVQSTWLISPQGNSIMIVPDTVSINDSYVGTRMYLTQRYLRRVCRLGFSVFAGPTVRSLILNLSKRSCGNIRFVEYGSVNDVGSRSRSLDSQVDYLTVLNRIGCKWLFLTVLESRILSKMENASVPLKELAKTRDGVNPGPKLFRKRIINPDGLPKQTWRPLIEGKHIEPFRILPTKEVINYNPNLLTPSLKKQGASFRDPDIFKPPKLVNRQTADTLIFALDNKGLCSLNSVHNTKAKDGKWGTLLYLLGVLNSKVLCFYYRKVTGEVRDVFPQVHISALKELPIPELPLELSKAIGVLAEEITTALKGARGNTSGESLDVEEARDRLDKMVYKLYDLTPEEIEIVERSFK